VVEGVASRARRLRRLQRQLDEARRDLHEAIRDAHAAGYSIRTLAMVTDLSTGRVHQIIQAEGGEAGGRGR
jgi:DNA-directed RNA polymerase specialized sigma24 family protein